MRLPLESDGVRIGSAIALSSDSEGCPEAPGESGTGAGAGAGTGAESNHSESAGASAAGAGASKAGAYAKSDSAAAQELRTPSKSAKIRTREHMDTQRFILKYLLSFRIFIRQGVIFASALRRRIKEVKSFIKSEKYYKYIKQY